MPVDFDCFCPETGLCIDYDHFPTTFDGDSLTVAEEDIDHFQDTLIAVSGIVERIEKAYLDKPYVLIRLNEENPANKSIWIASLVKYDSNRVLLSDEIRVLGYFAKILVDNDTVAAKYNNDGFHVLGLCIVNVTRKYANIIPESYLQFDKWKEGIIFKKKE